VDQNSLLPKVETTKPPLLRTTMWLELAAIALFVAYLFAPAAESAARAGFDLLGGTAAHEHHLGAR
jgi:hypothetical protein